MNITNWHGKYLTMTFTNKSGLKSTQGILDANQSPILKIGEIEFTNEDISNYTVGNPKDYPYRRL